MKTITKGQRTIRVNSAKVAVVDITARNGCTAEVVDIHGNTRRHVARLSLVEANTLAAHVLAAEYICPKHWELVARS